MHNKLRQGVASMADIWQTTQWDERHFAEGLGFWEVNVFKALIYFYVTWNSLTYGNFRARLAWAMMTLGKEPYPADVNQDELAAGMEAATNFTPLVGSPGGSMRSAPLPGGMHQYQRVASKEGRTCAYCGHIAFQKCATCEAVGLGCMFVCGPKSARKQECMIKHVSGAPIKHSNFGFSDAARIKVAARRRARAPTVRTAMMRMKRRIPLAHLIGSHFAISLLEAWCNPGDVGCDGSGIQWP